MYSLSIMWCLDLNWVEFMVGGERCFCVTFGIYRVRSNPYMVCMVYESFSIKRSGPMVVFVDHLQLPE